jgi:hypothetical protein
MKKMHAFKSAGTAMFILTAVSSALAADGFKLRFPISGTLGGEIVANLPSEGWVGSVAITDINVDKVAGNDGNTLTLLKTVALPNMTAIEAGQKLNAAALLNPSLAAQLAAVVPGTGGQTLGAVAASQIAGKTASTTSTVLGDIKQRQTLANMTLVRLLSPDVQGGKLALAINIPYSLSLNVSSGFTSPPITSLSNWSPAAPSSPAVQSLAAGVVNSGYQTSLASQSQSGSVNTSGLGDIETSLLWEKTIDKFKIVGGATLALPTGNYSYVKDVISPNIGYGKYYTFRPGVGVAYTASETVTLGARGSLGFNTQNTENKVRSGDFYVIDLAAAFKTPIGVFGPHVTMMRQYTDDKKDGQIDPTLGANRVSLTGAGAFATFPIASIGAGLNLSYMKTIDARNSLAGSFVQARISKAF